MSFKKKYDIVVVGGGIAGVAAALASARRGVQTALVEKTILPGGLATSGLVIYYLALCDGRGRQVMYGLPEELFRACGTFGPTDIKDDWQDPDSRARLQTHFSAASLVLALDELLEQAGVDVWYDTLISRPVREGDRLTSLEAENKSGRGTLQADCFIDATGDADLAFWAQAPCEVGDNVLSIWALEASMKAARKAVENGDGGHLLSLYKKNGEESYLGISGKDVTRFVLESRRMLRDRYRRANRESDESDRNSLYPLTIPTQAAFRKTRRIDGQATITLGDAWRPGEEAVGLVVNSNGHGGVLKHVWEVPYRSLLPKGINNLLVAGRCMSVANDIWCVFRLIPAVAATGEIAGTAAALSVRSGCTPDQLQTDKLRKALRDAGMKCTLADVYGEEIPAVELVESAPPIRGFGMIEGQ